MEPDNKFTVQTGLDMQAKTLQNWANILQPGIHAKLVSRVTRLNHRAKTGYDVCRGDDITDAVHDLINEYAIYT